MRDLLVIVPSRGRPGRLADMLRAALALAESETDFVIGVDDDDPASYSLLWAALEPDLRPRVTVMSGPRDTVSGWTNHLAAGGQSRYRALASLGDDHMPRTQGWDRLLLGAIGAMGGTGFAYGDDGIQGAALPTAVAVSADIVRALGWMMPPSLRHYRIDDAWRDLGAGAGCLAYVPEVIIEHLHPGAGKAAFDATYADGASRDQEDEVAYQAWRRDRMAADIATVAALRSAV